MALSEESSRKLQEAREIKQQLAIDVIVANKYKGLVNIIMRYGKTFIGIGIIDRLYSDLISQYMSIDPFWLPKVLWVTDGVKLRDVKIPAEFKVAGKEGYLKNTTIVCWNSLKNIKGQWDLIILDEYQFITNKNSITLRNGTLTSDRIVGFTGTEPKDYYKNIILSKIGLKPLITITLDEGIQDNVISDYRATVIKFNLDNKTHDIEEFGKMITEQKRYDNITAAIEKYREEGRDIARLSGVRMKLLYGARGRLATMRLLMQYLNSKNKRGLAFSPYKNFAEKFPHHYHSTSAIKHYEDFQNKKVNSLVLVKTGGVGHTYEDLDYVIIGNPTQDNTGITTQNWGRGLLYKEGEPIDIYFITSANTVEETKWLKEALSDLDPSKITHTTIEELISK